MLALSKLETAARHPIPASHVDKVWVLEGVFAEHEVIKRELSLLRLSVEGAKGSSKEVDFANDDDARSICTVVPHELERV